jgi:putative spermidine/putrescine transport system permease protein
VTPVPGARPGGVAMSRGWLLLLPATLFLALGFVAPIVLLAATSLGGATGGLALGQYGRFLLDSFYRGFLTETLAISFVTTAVCAVLAYPLAYQLARAGVRARGMLLMLLIAPLMIGDVVRGYGWLIALGDYGVLNRAVLALGLVHAPVRLIFTPTGVIIGLVHVLLPFMVLPLAAAIGAIPIEIEEASLSLGARYGRVFRKVVLPLTLPGLAAGVVIVFALAMGSFAIPLFLGGVKVKMIGPLIFQQATLTVDWPFAAAISSVLFATSFLLLVAYTLAGATTRGGMQAAGP